MSRDARAAPASPRPNRRALQAQPRPHVRLPGRSATADAPARARSRHLDDTGFAAIALVQTERLRPSFVPARLGQTFFLSGYRLFVRRAGQPSLRGLYILRSDTDRRSMALLGNLLTHYRYRLAKVFVTERPGQLEIKVLTPNAEADLHVLADLESRPAPLPAGSPFRTLDEARRFAGPLPHTFDYEASTRSLVVVRATRAVWDPQPVNVDVRHATFFGRHPVPRR